MNGKYLLAATGAISLALGYMTGKGSTSGNITPPSTAAAVSSPNHPFSTKARIRPTGDDTLLDAILEGRAISAIPTADLADLIARLSQSDPGMDPLARAKQNYQFRLLLSKLSPANLKEIAYSIASDPESKKNGGLRTIISALASKDADSALDWVSTRRDSSYLLSTVLATIARDDPYRAADLLHESLFEGNFTSNELWTATYGIGTAMAKLGADPFLGFIKRLPDRQQGSVMQNAISFVPEDERLKLLDELHLRKAGGNYREGAISNLFSAVFSSDETGAREWFSKLPEGPDKDNLLTNTAISFIHNGDKESATAWLRQAMASSPGKEKKTLLDVIGNMAYNNPGDVPYYAALLPEGLEYTAKDMENNALKSIYSGSGGLTALASIIRDPAEQARLIAGTLDKVAVGRQSTYTFNTTDLEILSRKIATMGFRGENAALVHAALETARKPPPPAK